MSKVLSIPILEMKELGTENNLPEVIQLVSSKARIWTQAARLQPWVYLFCYNAHGGREVKNQ